MVSAKRDDDPEWIPPERRSEDTGDEWTYTPAPPFRREESPETPADREVRLMFEAIGPLQRKAAEKRLQLHEERMREVRLREAEEKKRLEEREKAMARYNKAKRWKTRSRERQFGPQPQPSQNPSLGLHLNLERPLVVKFPCVRF